jgi:hypothetical protein
MQRNALIISFLVFCTTVQAQTRYGFLLPDSAIYSVTSLSNTLYVGIDNRLHMDNSLWTHYDSIAFKCNNGHLLLDSTYFVIPSRAGNLRIEVHGYVNGKKDTLGFSRFKVLPLPAPKIVFGSTIIDDSMRINNEIFIQADSLYIALSDDIPASKNWIEVREFSIGYNYGGYFIEETSESNAITKEMKAFIAKYGTGKWFSVKVITQSGDALLLTNPMYKVFFY